MALVGFELTPCWLRARRFNHSTTLPTCELHQKLYYAPKVMNCYGTHGFIIVAFFQLFMNCELHQKLYKQYITME